MEVSDIINDGDKFLCKRVWDDKPFKVGKWYEMRNYCNGNYWVICICNDCLYSLPLHDFWKYFHTRKEVRRIKLDKINEK